MTKTELKFVLKLHHDWKVNYRRDYAKLLLTITDGKILSLFESFASERISLFHSINIYNDQINWTALYSHICRQMHAASIISIDEEKYLYNDTDSVQKLFD